MLWGEYSCHITAYCCFSLLCCGESTAVILQLIAASLYYVVGRVQLSYYSLLLLLFTMLWGEYSCHITAYCCFSLLCCGESTAVILQLIAASLYYVVGRVQLSYYSLLLLLFTMLWGEYSCHITAYCCFSLLCCGESTAVILQLIAASLYYVVGRVQLSYYSLLLLLFTMLWGEYSCHIQTLWSYQ